MRIPGTAGAEVIAESFAKQAIIVIVVAAFATLALGPKTALTSVTSIRQRHASKLNRIAVSDIGEGKDL